MKKVAILLAAAFMTACGGAENKSEVTVMSFNIRYGMANDGDHSWENRKEAVVKMISAVDPDVIGLQEALAMQNEFLMENLTGYGMVGVGRDDGMEAGEFMTVLFKTGRYDLLDSGNFWLSETPDEVSRGWDGACNRMCTWVELQDKESGRRFRFFNTHLDHKGQQARREGTRLLVERILEKTGPRGTAFVTGDFNAVAQDEALAPLFGNFDSARDKAPETDTHGTFNGFGSAPNSVVIDYIFSRRATPVWFRTVTDDFGVPYVSDHYPIAAKFKF